MPRIPLSHVVAGQKLARPLTNAAGVVMMQAGTELTAPLIERLATLGVEAVMVAGDESESQVSPEEVRRLIDARFRGHDEDPWMMELKAIVLRQALRGGDGA